MKFSANFLNQSWG